MLYESGKHGYNATQRSTDMGFFGADSRYRQLIFSKILNLVFCFIVNSIAYSMPYLFSKTSKIRIYELRIFKLQQLHYFAMTFN